MLFSIPVSGIKNVNVCLSPLFNFQFNFVTPLFLCSGQVWAQHLFVKEGKKVMFRLKIPVLVTSNTPIKHFPFKIVFCLVATNCHGWKLAWGFLESTQWLHTFKCQRAVTGRAIFPPASQPSSPLDMTGQVLNFQSERDITSFIEMTICYVAYTDVNISVVCKNISCPHFILETEL